MSDHEEVCECGGTALHYENDVVGEHLVITGEQCDACNVFGSDIDAARFVAWCHPMYRWLVYRTEEEVVVKFNVHEPMPADMPIIEEAGEFYLTTDDERDAFAEMLAWHR